ncbi:thioredoxin family protein [Roseibacillus ishigakijimensis]|uniref:Thioredoxin domain-containing protein n=1 Tax=Roseibacillus ishigakijimensis TaxID=454146 RepID=A0A934RQN4_9BACT|nr:thioredoxin family protein [Roseibacillus ishigakijimensis]MBK1835148.1 hypothetical protein [Roseibacillus ishigakijimensis]
MPCRFGFLLLCLVFLLTACQRQEGESGGPELLPEGESLAAGEGLPVVREVRVLGGEDFLPAIARRDRIVVVEFFSEDCLPCRQLAVRMEKLAGEGIAGVEFAKLKVESHPALSKEYGVRLVPDTRIFHGGRELGGFVGVRSEATLRYLAEQYLRSVPRAAP